MTLHESVAPLKNDFLKDMDRQDVSLNKAHHYIPVNMPVMGLYWADVASIGQYLAGSRT